MYTCTYFTALECTYFTALEQYISEVINYTNDIYDYPTGVIVWHVHVHVCIFIGVFIGGPANLESSAISADLGKQVSGKTIISTLPLTYTDILLHYITYCCAFV